MKWKKTFGRLKLFSNLLNKPGSSPGAIKGFFFQRWEPWSAGCLGMDGGRSSGGTEN